MKIIRDEETNAILNKDNQLLAEYRRSRKRRREKDIRISQLETRLDAIEKLIERLNK